MTSKDYEEWMHRREIRQEMKRFERPSVAELRKWLKCGGEVCRKVNPVNMQDSCELLLDCEEVKRILDS